MAMLVDALACRLHIPSLDIRLIWCLGKGDERSNLAALYTWVARQLNVTAMQDTPAQIDILSTRLESHLSQYIGACGSR